MYRAIIFDFFDVFRTDSYKAWLAANGLKREGPYHDAAYQQDIGTITLEQFLEKLSELTGRTVTKAELEASTKLDQEVVAIAAALKGHCQVGLLSNAPSSLIRELLAEHDLERHFDHIVISSEVGLAKPDAAIFRHMLEQLGVTASEAVFVDDNPAYVRAAEAVGIKGVQFHSAVQLKSDLTRLGFNLL